MKKRNQFLILNIFAICVNLLLLLGLYNVYSPIGKVTTLLKNFNSGLMDSVGVNLLEDIQSFDIISFSENAKLFFMCLAATLTLAIFLMNFYLFKEKKKGVLVATIFNCFEFITLIIFLNSVISLFEENIFSNLYESDILNYFNSVNNNYNLAFIVCLIGLVFHIIILLDIQNKIHLSCFNGWMPTKIIEEKNQSIINTNQQTDIYNIFDKIDQNSSGGRNDS